MLMPTGSLQLLLLLLWLPAAGMRTALDGLGHDIIIIGADCMVAQSGHPLPLPSDFHFHRTATFTPLHKYNYVYKKCKFKKNVHV